MGRGTLHTEAGPGTQLDRIYVIVISFATWMLTDRDTHIPIPSMRGPQQVKPSGPKEYFNILVA